MVLKREADALGLVLLEEVYHRRLGGLGWGPGIGYLGVVCFSFLLLGVWLFNTESFPVAQVGLELVLLPPPSKELGL